MVGEVAQGAILSDTHTLELGQTFTAKNALTLTQVISLYSDATLISRCPSLLWLYIYIYIIDFILLLISA